MCSAGVAVQETGADVQGLCGAQLLPYDCDARERTET